MSDAEVEDKFTRFFSSCYGSERRSKHLITLVNGLEQLDDIGGLFAGFARRTNPRRRGRIEASGAG
jgi:hypothetical protein